MAKITVSLGEFLAQEALKHVGQCYVWGGAPGPSFTGCWDCSSCVNSIVGGIGKQPIPGFPAGTYDGTTHGPNTTIWLGSIGTVVGEIPRSAVDAGDIMCWATHMGLAIDNVHMVSAEDPANGTQIGVIDGFIPDETLHCLRLPAIGKGGFVPPPISFTGTQTIEEAARSVAKSARGLVWAKQRTANLGRHGWRV